MQDIIKWLIYGGLFLVPCLTVYVANDFFFPYITGKNFGFRIIVEVVVALYVILALYDKTYRPRFSWILTAFSALVLVMAVATFGARDPHTALWSNFERMDGYITLIHMFLYFVVLGAMLRTPKEWMYFFHTSLVVAAYVAYRGLVQLSGDTVRVDSTLGNAAYMAVYMLFHIFIAAMYALRSQVTLHRVVYGLLILMFTYVLLATGTRGTAIGLATGSLAAVAYMALFAVRHAHVRRYALGGLAVLALVFGSFYTMRDSEYVQSNPSLARIANIDLGEDLRIRSIIWSMSVAGIEQRPLLGWGNGNFNYVFNEQFDPRLYAQEQWFDRVHNLAFDWLIAGGIVGFLAYISVFAAVAYYLVIKAWRGDDRLHIIERGVIFGLLVGYLTHNLVVFDNIVSYIFFAAILAYLHARYSDAWPTVDRVTVPQPLVTQVVAPIVLVGMVVTVYLVNIPGINAAQGIIDAFRTQNFAERLTIFEEVLAYDSFARQEIVEQLAQQAIGVAQAGPAVSDEVRERFLATAERELTALVAAKPGDARLHVFTSSYYRAIGNFERAREELAIARSLSPRKQVIILQQGAVEVATNNNEAALTFFQEAYDLDTNNDDAKEYLIATMYLTGRADAARALLNDASDAFKDRVAVSDYMLSAANTAKDYELVAQIYEARTQANPATAQHWVSLAVAYYELSKAATSTEGERKQLLINKSIETLERGAKAVPSLSKLATCVTANIKSGKAPETGCQ